MWRGNRKKEREGGRHTERHRQMDRQTETDRQKQSEKTVIHAILSPNEMHNII